MSTVDPIVHRPHLVRVGSHCRVDCTCGWRGPQVAMFGHGTPAWTVHFTSTTIIDAGGIA